MSAIAGFKIPFGLRIPLLGYAYRVEGKNSDGNQETAYSVIGRNEARGSIKHNPNHVAAAARMSTELRFQSWGEVKATRTNIINAWLLS